MPNFLRAAADRVIAPSGPAGMKAAGAGSGVTTGMLLSPWKNNRPMWSDWSTDKAVREGFKASTWVYACVKRLMDAAASVPWVASRRVDEDTWERVPDHPLELLMDKPNPFMSGQLLVKFLVAHLCLGGNALWSKVRVRKAVVELWPIGPDGVKVVPNRESFIARYEYEKEGVKREFDPQDVIHMMLPDPSNVYWGLAPLQAAARVVDTDIEAVKWNKVALQNRAIADGIITFKRDLTKEQWEKARQMLREQHQGADNARTPWVLGNEAVWNQISLSPAEMDFIDSRRMTREEICAVFGVPPPLVGIQDASSYNNILTARRILWLDTVIPLLESIESALNLALTPEFGEDLWLEYDVSNVDALQEEFGKKVATAKTLWDMGVPFNKINQRLELGFDDLPWGDEGFLPFSVMPAGGVGEEAEIPETGQDGRAADSESPASDGEREDGDGEAGREARGAGKAVSRLRALKAFDLMTEEQKAAYWKAHDLDRRRWENGVAKRVSDRFAEEAKAVARACRDATARAAGSGAGDGEKITDADAVVAAVERAIEDGREAWKKLLSAVYLSVIEHFGKRIAEQFPVSASVAGETGPKAGAGPGEVAGANAGPAERKFVFDPWRAETLLWVARWAGDKIKDIEETTKIRIRKAVFKGIAENEGTAGIAKRIRAEYEDFGRYRSFVIARTEVGAAAGCGSREAAKQTGLKLRKKWLSSRDDRVRDSHRDIDGEEREMDERYSNGCMYPGDPDGPAAEVIQCRCVEVYVPADK